MEHDCSEVFVSAGCIPQEVCTPLHEGGCGGDLSPPRGSGGADPPRLRGPRASGSPVRVEGSAPEAKNRCKIAL